MKDLGEVSPDSCDLYESGLVDTFYPQRPNELKDCCLYDFKKWYKFNGIDSEGKRVYYKLNKPVLPNHRIYDPAKEDQRENYYYSLLIPFKPFHDELSLVKNGQTAEEAFNEFMATGGEMNNHHDNLLKMLNAQSKVHSTNQYHAKIKETVIEKKESVQEGPEILAEAASACMMFVISIL